ncbi:hypothetical protein KCP69_05570 [Salmonella enterica subsp. enterica]|nr:hypothetical protein KCP69_05570 [Salmonella enterica subsp. enterica]
MAIAALKLGERQRRLVLISIRAGLRPVAIMPKTQRRVLTGWSRTAGAPATEAAESTVVANIPAGPLRELAPRPAYRPPEALPGFQVFRQPKWKRLRCLRFFSSFSPRPGRKGVECAALYGRVRNTYRWSPGHAFLHTTALTPSGTETSLKSPLKFFPK